MLGRLSQLQENAHRTKIFGSQLCQFAYNTTLPKSLLIEYPPFILLRCVLYIELKPSSLDFLSKFPVHYSTMHDNFCVLEFQNWHVLIILN